jgi:very-short-patch-repair endonuclease
MTSNTIIVHHRSPISAKIALFRSLFRGREDVYPRRFESRKTGRCGYQPVCANEWARGLCEKPKVKCSACAHRQFLSVTDDAIYRHLSGHDPEGRPFVMGIYPMLQNATCLFLAMDFDKTTWQEDIAALEKTYQGWKLPIVMERSRSGNGGHAWIFFSEANLFACTACTVMPESVGIERARSATEAFLYRRLETLPETAGKFQLNVNMAIPFDGWGQMEVDLLCANARVIIEIDGMQHLANAEAYRRDRRKDRLLQEHGFFVLRFLAEDVGKNLDHVLDAILRTLPHCQQNVSPEA